MLICVYIVPRARDGTSVMTFSCVHRRGPVGFLSRPCFALKHMILSHFCHLGLIVSWSRSARGQRPLLFLPQPIRLHLPRLAVMLPGRGAEERAAVSQGGERRWDTQCQTELNQLRHIKSRICER